MFSNISSPINTANYLPILNAALVTDLIFLFFLLFGVIHTRYLEEWYRKYTIAAVMEDVLILVIGVLLARFLYRPLFGAEPFSLWKFTALAVCIQILHDILFYIMFQRIPRGKNKMMDTFQDYAREVGLYAILADSCMIALTCVLSSVYASWSVNSNVVLLIFVLYMFPYTIYAF